MSALQNIEPAVRAAEVGTAYRPGAATPAGECLTFRLGIEEYGIEILKVQEIRGYEQPTRIANSAVFIKGVLNLPVSALKVASIALRKPANRNLAVSLTAEQFRYGFGNVLSAQESAELYDRWTVPSPGKPLFEAALANFTPNSPAKVNTANKTRGPLLLTAGGKDHTVPAAITTSTRKLYHKSPAITDFIEFPDRGHSLTIDHGWREVAQAALDWLRQRSL
jgi:pimeloyl-ACP methyl ester carboxylesterase